MAYSLKTRRLPTIVGLTFALGWPVIFQITQHHQNLGDVGQDEFVVAAEWIALIVLFAIIVFWEHLPALGSVGIGRPRVADVAIVLGLIVLAIVLVALFAHARVKIPKSNALAQVFGIPLGLRIALVFTAGVCEEVFFRGYAIERLRALTGNIWIGALVGTVLFTLGHIPRYGFSAGLFGVAFIGALLSLLYIWRRNLLPCIALHWLFDGLSLLALPAVASLVAK